MEWQNAFEILSSTNIYDIYKNPIISHDQYLEDLKLLEKIFPNKYLNSNSGPTEVRDGISDLINGPRETVGYYCKRTHAIAELIRLTKPIPGFERLEKQLHSDRGFINQLLATCYWLNVFGVTHIEQVFDNHDADIVSQYGDKKLKIHVKTVDQKSKEDRVFEATCHIDSIIRSDSDIVNGLSLGLSNFIGVVPPNITKDIWKELLDNTPRIPGSYSISIDDSHKVELEFDYTNTGKMSGPNVLWNLNSHRSKLENRIPDTDPDINILLCVTTARVKDIYLINQEYLENTKIDIELFIEVHPMAAYDEINYTRSNIFCKKEMTDLCVELNNIPIEYNLKVIRNEHK